MRDAVTKNSGNLGAGELAWEFPIRFTGDAIEHLSTSTLINLKDWKWHEEDINGQRHYIITDRLPINVNA